MAHTLSDSNLLQHNQDQVWWLAIMYLWHNSSCLVSEENLPKWWVQSPSKRAHLKHLISWLRTNGKCKLPRWGRLLKVMHHQYISAERLTYPHAPVNAVSSMLNFGSPKPPVLTVPEGFETCCIIFWEATKLSICPPNDRSRPKVYLERT